AAGERRDAEDDRREDREDAGAEEDVEEDVPAALLLGWLAATGRAGDGPRRRRGHGRRTAGIGLGGAGLHRVTIRRPIAAGCRAGRALPPCAPGTRPQDFGRRFAVSAIRVKSLPKNATSVRSGDAVKSDVFVRPSSASQSRSTGPETSYRPFGARWPAGSS